MTDPQPVDVVALDADIVKAWAEVKQCRLAWSRSPNGETILNHELAERHLNHLLEFRFAAQPWLTKREVTA
jgi:hypothetical protein